MVSKVLLLTFICLAFVTVSIRADEEATPAATETTTEEPKVSSDVFTPEEREVVAKSEEKHEFQAEVTRLMDIIINSLYSKREIFVREIISNAADALDKIRYLSLTNQTALTEGTEKLEIRISFDRDRKTLTFLDTGVGMTKADLIKNLGIVARSGTTEFVEAATKGTDSDALALIGQFGVGFYSVYLVADRVTVISKNNDDKQHVWESTAEKTFTVSEDPRGPTLGRGTQVTLHLKPDAEDFLNEHELKKLVERYSEFINYPIYLYTTKTVDEDVPDEDAAKEEEKKPEEEKKEGDDTTVSEEEELEVKEESEEEKKPKTKKVTKQVSDWERLNDVKAIWTRSPKDITEEEYGAFFKTLTKGEDAHLTKIHFTAEGEITFRAILYVPKKAPAQLYDKFYEKSTALKLYVRRVLISDEFEDFLPRYLNFVKGVVDSEDLPLNVSRETLAQNRVLKVMAKKITRKVLEMLKKLADDSRRAAEERKEKEEAGEEAAADDKEKKDEKDKEDDYITFWKAFGKSIKLGVIDDRSNKAKLSKLLRFETSKSEGKLVGLEDYVDRMKPKQKNIFYITGESIEQVKNSPFLERLKKKDLEVIYMVDPLDEYLVQSLTEFDGTTLQSITKEGLKLGDEDKLSKWKDEFKDLTTWLSKVYGDKVEKVTISNRIANTPCVLVTSQYGWSANMERIMKAQTFANAGEATYMHAKKVMEINPRHPIIKELKVKTAEDASDKALIDLANLLFDAALLQSGFSMKDTTDFATRIHRVVSSGLSLDPNAEAEEETEEDEAPAESGSGSGENGGESSGESHESATESGSSNEEESAASQSDAHDEL